MMAKLPDMGTIAPDVFPHLIWTQLCARDRRVLVPLQHGVNLGMVAIDDGQATAQVTG